MAVDAKTPGVGTVLEDRYRLLSEIGRGGMGTIYRAHDQTLERDVAVKVDNRRLQGRGKGG